MALASVILDAKVPYRPLEALLYDRVIAPAVAGMEERVRATYESDLKSATRILDVGCGGGQNLLNMIKRYPHLNGIGLDLSPEQVSRASKRANKAGANLRFVRGSALDQPFADNEFDAVVSIASIKHWPDPLLGLQECVRVLRPGGRLMVVEGDRGATREDAKAFVSAWRLPQALHRVALPFFLTSVLAQSISLDEAREMIAALPLDDAEVKRIPQSPGLLLTGRKRDER